MKRVIVFLIIMGLLSYVIPAGMRMAAAEDAGSGRVQVSIELPPEFMELGEGRLESRLRNIIPPGFTVEKIKGGTAILSGNRAQLSELEGSGLEIVEIDTISGGRRQAGRLSRGADLAFRENWGPFTYPGEIITDISINVTGDEDEVAVGTRNSDWSQGKFYYYDYQGTMLQSASFPRGVDDILYGYDIDTSGNEGVCAVTRNSGNTEAGVYFYSETGVAMGNWTTAASGISDVDSIDLDDDGYENLIVASNGVVYNYEIIGTFIEKQSADKYYALGK